MHILCTLLTYCLRMVCSYACFTRICVIAYFLYDRGCHCGCTAIHCTSGIATCLSHRVSPQPPAAPAGLAGAGLRRILACVRECVRGLRPRARAREGRRDQPAGVERDGTRWGGVGWNETRWNWVGFNRMGWNGMELNGMGLNGME